MDSSKQKANPYSQTVSHGHVELHEELDEPNAVLVNAESLKCPTCYEFFRNAPVVLACGHSFCNDCLDRMKTLTVGRLIRCPMCRQEAVPAQVRNYAIGQIVDSAEKYAETSITESQASQNLKFKNEQLKDETNKLRTQRAQHQEEAPSPWVIGGLGALAGAVGVGLMWMLTSGNKKKDRRGQ
ncbi:hypothetical protein L596_023213 [Steinernema carpocapsae]|uniref:RING-type domain-containing protein n=1 Tax=Steinernema carpocapsae TaxID=34508 RepID=A0A4U5MCZ6_STECR|nr:hypothetical protein L596_023213 [Steinernema carpocapsae]